LVSIEQRGGPTSISRVNQERVLSINAGTDDRPFGEVAAATERALKKLAVPEGFTVSLGGEMGEQEKTFSNLLIGIVLAAFLVYSTMAVLFESLRHPLVVMLSVPFAFIGAIGALIVTGTTLNMNSVLGMIVLVGIVVNNAIVLVDFTNMLQREDGVDLKLALVMAGSRRLRPILMTTLTTVFALVPLASGISEGSEIQAPLARVVIGGLTTSTLVTLLLVPCGYYLVERRRAARG
jgi:HAE1 family hydrophobic/amphiphilic exporter-1